MASIGLRILELIKSRGMTQKEFSEKTGIAQSTISDWRGEVLGVSPEDLLSGEVSTRARGVDYICVDKGSPEYHIVMEYRKLAASDRDRLEGYLKGLSRL